MHHFCFDVSGVCYNLSTVKKPGMPVPDIAALEQTIAYHFHDRQLLERALTHRSWAHESVAPGHEDLARQVHNEVFEFVGDSVLGLVVADYLFQSYRKSTEGELSRMKHRLVSATTLTRAAKRLSLGDYLRVGRGEEKTGGRTKAALLADAFEAVLAAIFFDGGYDSAKAFVHLALDHEFASVDPEVAAAADYKTLLQERHQAEFGVPPRYEVVKTAGPPHRRSFCVEVHWHGGSVRGEGHTIKSAEAVAARNALEQMQETMGSS
jgi:ribonuclease III